MVKRYIQIVVVLVIVVAAVVYGFTQFGPLATQRSQNADQTRISNLSTLRNSVQDYYFSKWKLPARLSDLSGLPNKNSLKDPETGKMYDYKVIGVTSYQLCATFKMDAPKETGSGVGSNVGINSLFKYSKGYHCFNLNIDYLSSIPKILNLPTLPPILPGLKYASSSSDVKKSTTCSKYGLEKNVNGIDAFTVNGKLIIVINSQYWQVGIDSSNQNFGLIFDSDTKFINKSQSSFEAGDCITAVIKSGEAKVSTISLQ